MEVRSGKGFTLIELLVVTTIVGLIVGVIVACIGGGIRVWEVAQSTGVVDREILIGQEVLRRDLMNAFVFYDIPFRGEATRISFPGYERGEGTNAMSGYRPGTVEYFMDPAGGRMLRKHWPYPGREEEADSEPIMNRLLSVQFRYSGTAGGKDAVWMDVWNDPSNHPGAVKMDLVMNAGAGPVGMQEIVVLSGVGVKDETK